ncbi:MAG TPA: prolyl oligopeptidase family serine peptidase [Trebonia sp.]
MGASGSEVGAGDGGRLRRFARSRRFLLGRPRDVAFASEAGLLLFLRSLAPDDPVTGLWALSMETGQERLLVDPRELLGGAAEEISAAEFRRRERMRESARGIVAYSLGAGGRLAVFGLSGRLFACDVADGRTREIPVTGPCLDPQVSPDGGAVGYLVGRALRVTSLDGRVLVELSEDDPQLSFGAAEFGAEEEMGRHHGYWWSPDGRQLLVARVSEHDVASWWLSDPSDAAAVPVRQRYPFAGTANPEVRLLLVGLDGTTVSIDLPSTQLPYLLDARWDAAGRPLLMLLSRDHQRREVRAVDPVSGATELLHADADPAWLERLPGTPRWLPDGRLLHTAHSQDEDTHRLTIDGAPVTPPGLQVLSVAGASAERVVFCATREPTERHLYSLDQRSGEITPLTSEPGLHGATVAGTMAAITSETLDADGVTVRVLDGDREVAVVRSLPQRAFAPGVTLLTAGERELRAALILPRDEVRPAGPLPVIMDPYGGPLSQRVLRARRLFYEPQWLADQGFAVLVADGRGSPARGPRWERAIGLDLATAALDDQVAALEHVARRYPGELDLARVGIRGWSFGGYLAALAVLRRPDVFAAAIAGAAVTEWRWYDTVATERYLGHPERHPEAYQRSSLLPLAAGLTRPLLLVHGLADDNVHPRHSLLIAREFLAAGRDHELLALPGVTHMVWQPEIIEQLLDAHVRFFRRWLTA